MLIGGRHFDFSSAYIMGILNITPDSFSDGGLYLDPEKALERALQMQEEGADFIDVGGESTRPGAEPVGGAEELRRILPVLKKVIPKIKIPVSIDTRHASTALAAVSEGVALVNDVSALGDAGMAGVISKSGVPIVLMHMKGEPQTMQIRPSYEDPVREIGLFLEEKISFAVRNGIDRKKILVDPGVGFGKRFEDNLEIFKRLSEFKKLGCPVVFGSSRKSFVKKLFGEEPSRILTGNLVTGLLAVERGASILRVHDVRDLKDMILKAVV